ncbi:serine hydrolase domain-containing protein [Streptomyces tubercidicus]|uniref:serine hydrolase domain-containing protein n=1 Tax=Streptomyces tubercidicus TaxID=47759 RepID=UPI00378DB84C
MTLAQSTAQPTAQSTEVSPSEPVRQEPGAAGTPEEFTELLPQTRRALLRRLAVGQAEGRAPSMVGAVVRDGRVVWTEGRGTVEGEVPHGDLQYRIGSLTKTFVAVLVLRLRDEGLLRLADPVCRHLEGTPVPDATIAQLLSHSAGLAAEPRGPWWERTTGALRPEPADLFDEHSQPLPAGRRHHYSNVGYALLGALVERLRGGVPWGEVLRREVLEPLGMGRTTLLPEPPYASGWAVHPWADVLLPEPAEDTGLMGPAGQLWSTLQDLCRWAAFLLRGDERVLGAESLAELRTPAVPPESGTWDAGYGLGVQLLRREGRLLVGHHGSMPGFLAALWADAEEDVAAVVLTNCTSGPAAGAVATDLTGIVIAHEPRIPEPWSPLPGPLDPELLALTGPWYWGANPHALRLRAERGLELTSLSRAGRASRFRAEKDGTWTGLDGYYAGETLRVRRDGDGAVSHLDLGTFVFTRGPYEPSAPVPGGVDPEGWRV